jgi:hypothetical protein
MIRVSKESLSPVDREQIILSLRQCEHKPGVDSMDWHKVNDKLLILAGYTVIFCKERALPVIFTSIIRPQIKGVSKSKTHEQGRAFDLSVRSWTKAQINEFVTKINKEFKLGAVSATDGTEREAIFEDDEFDKNGKQVKWRHLHVQCRP